MRGADPVNRLSSIDVNEDGFLDVAGRQGGSLTWWPGNGDGTFGDPQTLLSPYVLDFAIGDFTGDGRLDVIASAEGKLVMFPATGSGRGPSVEQIMMGDEYQLRPLQYDTDPELELVAWIAHEDFTVLDRIGTTFTEVLRVTPPALFKITTAADFDQDGRVDLVIDGGSGSTVYFGAAASPYTQTVTLGGSSSAAGDIDGDGDLDVVTKEQSVDKYNIHRNDGGRTFTSSSVLYADAAGAGLSLLTDVTGDGRADLVTSTSLAEGNPLLTFSGDESGTLRQPPTTFRAYENNSYSTSSIATGDFTNDGALDLAFSQGSEIHTVRAVCETEVLLHAASFHVSVGSTLELEVSVAGFHPHDVTSPATVDLREGTGSVIATTGVDPQGLATFSVPGLATGDYSFKAEFSGNEDLFAGESDPLAVRVSDALTTLTVIAPLNHVYGTPVPFWIESNNPVSVRLDINGVESSAPTNSNFTRTLNAGTHTIFARFPGDDDYPAGRSETITVNVAKAPSVIRFISGNLGVRAGQQHQLAFTVTYAAAGNVAPGTVTLRKDGVVIGSANLATGLAIVSAQLAEGSHKVDATYEGTANIQGSSEPLYLEVVAGTALVLRAHSAQGYIQVNVVYPADTVYSWLYRRPAGAATWTYASDWDANTGRDYSAVPGIVYEYRMEAEDSSDMFFDSNPDWAIVFSDDPIALRSTTVKGKHFTELRDMINVLRAKATLAPFAFHSSFGTGKPILAGHVVSLYNATLQAYGNLGMGTPTFTTVSNGQPIRALQIQQLRDALR